MFPLTMIWIKLLCVVQFIYLSKLKLDLKSFCDFTSPPSSKVSISLTNDAQLFLSCFELIKYFVVSPYRFVTPNDLE